MGPGPEPRGRDGITQVESGHDILLPDADTWNRIGQSNGAYSDRLEWQ